MKICLTLNRYKLQKQSKRIDETVILCPAYETKPGILRETHGCSLFSSQVPAAGHPCSFTAGHFRSSFVSLMHLNRIKQVPLLQVRGAISGGKRDAYVSGSGKLSLTSREIDCE